MRGSEWQGEPCKGHAVCSSQQRAHAVQGRSRSPESYKVSSTTNVYSFRLKLGLQVIKDMFPSEADQSVLTAALHRGHHAQCYAPYTTEGGCEAMLTSAALRAFVGPSERSLKVLPTSRRRGHLRASAPLLCTLRTRRSAPRYGSLSLLETGSHTMSI